MHSKPILLSYKGYSPAEIHSPIRASDLESWRETWLPHFERLAKRGFPQPDAAWNWEAMLPWSTHSFAVTCLGDTHGMMLVNAGLTSILNSPGGGRRRSKIVYVKAIASAPQNRELDPASSSPCFGLVGSALMRAAVELSLELGFRGRVGLHALREAEQWYQKIGMTAQASPTGLTYYEFSSQAASKFLKPE
jgi:hypothetical protein